MAFVSQTPIRRNSHLVPAGIALALAGLIAPVHLTLFGLSWPLVWIPFAVTAIWPRQAAPVASAVVLFIGGLWVDWATLGATGQWPLVFLLTYFVLRPDQAESSRGTVVGLIRMAMALMVGVPIFVLTGFLIYGVWPDWAALGRGVSMAIIWLQLIAFLRDLFAGRVTREDY